MQVLQTRICGKYHMELRQDLSDPEKTYLAIVKTTNGIEIDLGKEPVILFRGRDKLALPMLEHYRRLCLEDGCTDYQLTALEAMIERFEVFADESPTMMKQPGSTKGE